jgi:hypothetical protein
MSNKNRFNTEQPDYGCKPWQLSKSTDTGIIDQYGGEAMAIGGADVNVFKLLGVHEQGKLVDLTGSGTAISGGTANGSSANNAFTSDPCKKFWRSLQKGPTDVLREAYIGYNFGVPLLDNGRQRYGVNVDIKQHITTIRIKQSENPNRRATRVRVERSDDGQKWLGVDLIALPDNDQLNQISLKQSALTRYWRLRPVEFKGSESDFWEVQSIELIDWDQTNLFQVQDEYGWIENRDRDYADKSIPIKGFYDLYEKETDLTQFGFAATGSLYYFTVNFNDIVNRLGRPIVIGDIFELPSEAQYDPDMKLILKYLEVTDVSWSAEGYTPGWQPTMLRIIAEPMLAKQETMDIIGDMTAAIDQSGLFDIDESKYSELASKQSEVGREKAEQQVPLRGSDTAEFETFDESDPRTEAYAKENIDIRKIGIRQNALYVEDAMPKNGEEYTQGREYPPNPVDGAYHRVVYEGMADNIPARLYKYSAKKGRWVFLESDKRAEFNPQKPTIQKLKNSKDAISMRNIGK